MISLDKNTGINLKKGTSISLEKEGVKLKHICIGLNWGAINKKGILRTITRRNIIPVDLDGAVSLFAGKTIAETVYYRNLNSENGSVRHSGDDLTGDLEGDDGIDNEVITINLEKIQDYITSIYIYLNSYKGQDFGAIPYSKLRIFEGTPGSVNEVLATFNLSVEKKFNGYVSMVMGKLVKTSSNWKFIAIGDPISPKDIEEIVGEIRAQYVVNRRA
jgi:tellurium resistance protein TerZ